MDRRVLLAVVLMMAVAIVPSMLLKKQPVSRAVGQADSARPAPISADRPSLVPADSLPARATDQPSDSPSAPSEDTIVVSSPLYRYAFSTRGARLIGATLPKYQSMRPGEKGSPAEILPPGSNLLSLGILSGRDTVWLRDWSFVPSDTGLDVQGPTPLRLTTRQGGVAVSLVYTFRPDDYLVDITGTVEGLGPDGGVLLVGMGPGLRNTEADSAEHFRELGLVTKAAKASLTRFGKLKLGQPMSFNGPFEWVAVKSKYFVTALFVPDTTGSGLNGGIGGATALAVDTAMKTTSAASITAGIQVRPSGAFRYQLYAGPMEYPRLRAIGHDFDDVNPYGWPGFRTIIRPVALGARSLLVWMHDSLGLAYGVGLILFGILIRILLWPLNQKAMRSSMAMQAVAPMQKQIQEKYKGDALKAQQEISKLWKEHNVHPLGGCWPMLLPWPILLAFFFVFQNTIELRGAAFLWLPDLSRPDPVYVIPVVMGLSMYALTKIGQIGMEPNPQMKMLLYVMPGMMTFLFLNFPSGLNLYYTVMNIASLPQQWMLSKERLRRQAAGSPALSPMPPPPAALAPNRNKKPG
jgi:YidC/Oxa1 family membrane protein insertase